MTDILAGGDPDRLREGEDVWFRTLDGAGDAVIERGSATVIA